MGPSAPQPARVDVAVLLDVAHGFDAVAASVTAARRHLAGLAFDGTTAGRAHAARGDRLRAATGMLDDALRRWSDDAAQVASAQRTSAGRYARADADAAHRLG